MHVINANFKTLINFMHVNLQHHYFKTPLFPAKVHVIYLFVIVTRHIVIQC